MIMNDRIENSTLVLKANIYFDGKVVSHTLLFPDGSRKTVGCIYAGTYHFGTESSEIMQIIAGSCTVRQAGSGTWQEYPSGESFSVPAHSSFDIEVGQGILEYLCSYGK